MNAAVDLVHFPEDRAEERALSRSHAAQDRAKLAWLSSAPAIVSGVQNLEEKKKGVPRTLT